jgi:predicted transcriptional regulator of viral defense system
VEPEPVGSAAELLIELAARGRYHFTTDEAMRALETSPVATRAALRRLKKKGGLASPHRGFHVIVPPEYRRLGCLPGEQFVPQLMEHLGLAYYVALLSAAQLSGAAHQQPQVLQVMVEKNRAPIACGSVRVEFVARRNAARIPVMERNTPRGSMRVSSPEATAFDLVGYPEHAGGLDHGATVLAELVRSIDGATLARVAPLSPVPWAQRLGYLLEQVGGSDRTEPLAAYVRESARETALLDPRRATRRGERDPRWRLVVNADVVPDGDSAQPAGTGATGPRAPRRPR